MQAYTAESVSGIGKQLAGSPGALEPYEAGGGWFPPCKPRELEYYMGKALSPAEMFGVLKANLDSMTMHSPQGTTGRQCVMHLAKPAK